MALPSSSTGPKKQRQTRIPEHLKAVKKSSSSSSLKSAASSSSAATTAAESASSVPSAASSAAHGGQLQAPRKSDISGNVKKSSSSSSSKTKQQMKKLHRLDTAAVPDTYVKASSPYAVSSSGLPASPYEAYPLTSPVRSANNSGVAAPSSSSSSSAISMGLPAIATSDHLTSPFRFNTTTTQYQAGQQLPIQIHHHHHQQQHTFLPANGQDQHQATLHSLNGSTHASSAVTSSVPARLPYGHLNAYAQGPGCAQAQLPSPSKVPYAVTNEHANELAASLERSASHGAFSYQPEQQMQMQMQMPLHNMANMSYAPPMTPSYSATHPTIPPGSSAALARSCSSQTSSMMMTQSYSQPAFTFAVPLAGSHNMSPQQQHPPQGAIYHGNQLAQAGPGSFGNGINHNNASSPAVSLHSGSSTGSISSAQSQAHSHEGYARSPRRSQTSMSGLSSISATPFSSMSAGSNIASAAHGAAAAVPSSSTPLANSYSATSPRTPGNGMASAAFSAPLLLSISSDGKACLTPQMRRSTDMSPLASVAEENSTPKPLRPTAMTRSSTMNSHKLPTRPSMMRSITTDPRMNSSSNNVKHDSLSASNNGKQEVSELDGVGRVVGQGKMFDLHDGKHALASSTSADRHIAALPRTLNLNIEMDLASGTGSTAGQTYSFSQVAYPPLTFSPNGMLLTPPQSTELANQQLPGSSNIPKQPHHMQHAVPFYPEKERFQSSWKFPSGMGLNLVNSDRKQSLQQGDPSASAASSPSSGIQSSFPSMTSLNASIVNVIKGQDDRAGPLSPANKTPNSSIGGASEDMSRRQSRIQAWLDSPEMHEGDNGGASSWSSLPPRDDQDHGSAPPTASSSESFSISPASIMTRTASELKLSSDSDFIEYEEFEVMRASGKSIQPLRVSRKRRYDDDDSGLSSKDRDAIKAGLGLPFQAIAPQREVTPTLTDGGSPGKKSKALKPDDEAAGASAATKLVKPSPTKKAPVKKGRKSKKKGSSKCICGETDNGDAMIQCDECASWFHLVCVDVDAENLPDEWHCPNCLEAQRPEQNGEEERQAQAAYPSPSSPSPSMLDLSVQETPKRPTISREPTFSKDATPKSASVRHFQDTHLALAPSPGPGAIPSTPQNTPAQFSAFHNRTASYSRSYAPVTPRQGFSAQVSAPGTGYQWDTYSPHTPSNSIIHARRPSRSHFKTPSSTWAALSHYAEVPSSSSRHGDEERTKQWEQFYNAPAPNPINPIPMTPPLTSHAPFASSESFLPPLEQEASVSQRFLAIHSTPSSWDDSSQFPSNMW